MKNKQSDDAGQGSYVDPDGVTHENGQDQTAEQELFGSEGVQADGTIFLPKITMATIRANPERAKMEMLNRPVKMALVTGIAGSEYLMPPADQQARFEAMDRNDIEYKTFCAIVATIDPWGCVRYDDNGEPDGVYKSDYLFLPVSHIAIIDRVRARGPSAIAWELWAQPAKNPRGYSWYLINLAKRDGNLSYVDRLLMRGVQVGRQLEMEGRSSGLLADLRAASPARLT